MADVIVDSSVAVKWVLPEADSHNAIALLTAVRKSNGRLLMVDVALAEVANAIWVKSFRGLITPGEAVDSLSDFLALPVEVIASRGLLPDALTLSSHQRIAVYDALFVVAADAADVTGVTADRPLVAAVAADHPRIQHFQAWQAPGP
jgi:predicted nucleic acid-binding protein